MGEQGAAGGKVVVNRAMSLDGYISGPGHVMDWIFEHMEPAAFPDVMAATGAFLAGRRTYEVGKAMGAVDGEAYGGQWSGPVFVLTHRPPDDAKDAGVTFLTQDVTTAVAIAREAAGAKSVEILGTDVTGQCLARGLVDEILVHVLPVLLGSGTPLLSHPHLGRISLEPIDTTRSGAVTTLRFRVPT